MAAKKNKSSAPQDLETDPVTTEICAAAVRGVSQTKRHLSQPHLVGAGVQIEVLARDHFVVWAPHPDDPARVLVARHVRVTAE